MDKSKKLGQEPAFPFTEEVIGDNSIRYTIVSPGINKRFYTACAVIQGMMSSGKIPILSDISGIVSYSYYIADELIRQENL